MRTVCVLVLVLMNPHACVVDIRAHGEQSVTSFEPGNQGGIMVVVWLNGQGPFRFLLDTGSTHSAVSDAVARDLGAPVVAKAVVGSAVGGDERIVVRIDRLEHGPLKVTDLLPAVMDLAGIDDGQVDGIIGQDVLAAHRYTIDFRHRALLWWPEASTVRSGTAFALEPSAGRFLVALPQPRTVLRLVPDSGAASLLLFEDTDEGVLPVTILPERAELRTLTARAAVRQARLHALHVGTTTLRDVDAVVVARHESIAPGTDGLLPLHLFERVTFDGPRRVLILEGTS